MNERTGGEGQGAGRSPGRGTPEGVEGQPHGIQPYQRREDQPP